MTDLRNQKRVAAELLKCGVNRLWVDPDRSEDIATAATRGDVRGLIKDGAIRLRRVNGTSRGRARKLKIQRDKGRRKGYGSRKGTKHARYSRKLSWMKRIRAIRTCLGELRDSGKIDRRTYRKFYLRSSGGTFRSVSHLKTHLQMEGIVLEGENA